MFVDWPAHLCTSELAFSLVPCLACSLVRSLSPAHHSRIAGLLRQSATCGSTLWDALVIGVPALAIGRFELLLRSVAPLLRHSGARRCIALRRFGALGWSLRIRCSATIWYSFGARYSFIVLHHSALSGARQSLVLGPSPRARHPRC